jgi:hypothetical protein
MTFRLHVGGCASQNRQQRRSKRQSACTSREKTARLDHITDFRDHISKLLIAAGGEPVTLWVRAVWHMCMCCVV